MLCMFVAMAVLPATPTVASSFTYLAGGCSMSHADSTTATKSPRSELACNTDGVALFMGVVTYDRHMTQQSPTATACEPDCGTSPGLAGSAQSYLTPKSHQHCSPEATRRGSKPPQPLWCSLAMSPIKPANNQQQSGIHCFQAHTPTQTKPPAAPCGQDLCTHCTRSCISRYVRRSPVAVCVCYKDTASMQGR